MYVIGMVPGGGGRAGDVTCLAFDDHFYRWPGLCFAGIVAITAWSRRADFFQHHLGPLDDVCVGAYIFRLGPCYAVLDGKD